MRTSSTLNNSLQVAPLSDLSTPLFDLTRVQKEVVFALALENPLKPELSPWMVAEEAITIKGHEMVIRPEKLEPESFYLVSFMGEKHVIRKTDEDRIEVYEVTE